MQVSEKTREKIFAVVQNDLEPSTSRVAAHLILAFGLGGGFSMLFCGQFGLGFSGFAIDLNHAMHSKIGAVLCTLLCGSIFAIAPVVVLRAISHPLLFRVIVRRYNLFQAALTLSIGMLAYSHGNLKVEVINVLLWSLSAFILFKGVGFAIDRFCSRWTVDADLTTRMV